MTDAQEAADPTAAAAAAAAAVAAEDDGDLDSEADDTRSKLENIKYYASLFLGTVSQSAGMYRGTHLLASVILGTVRYEAAARQSPLWVNFFSTCLL